MDILSVLMASQLVIAGGVILLNTVDPPEYACHEERRRAAVKTMKISMVMV